MDAVIGIIVSAVVGIPLVYILDKWKKEMDESEWTDIKTYTLVNACECWSIWRKKATRLLLQFPTQRTQNIIGGSLRVQPNLKIALRRILNSYKTEKNKLNFTNKGVKEKWKDTRTNVENVRRTATRAINTVDISALGTCIVTAAERRTSSIGTTANSFV